MKFFFFIILIVIFFSCKEDKQNQTGETQENKIIRPVITQLKQPEMILLKDRRQPLVNPVPQKMSDAYFTKWNLDRIRMKIVPPEIKPADFLTEMQVYNSEQIGGLSNVISGLLDSKGNLWFGTEGSGLIRYNGHSFDKFSKNHGLGDEWIMSMMEDSKGNLWFGTLRDGFIKYDGRHFSNYNKTNGFDVGAIRAVCEYDDNNIWLGSQNGVLVFDGTAIARYSTKEGIAGDFIWDILKDRSGTMWIATTTGLSKWNEGVFTNYSTTNGMAGNVLSSLYEDSKGNLWIGTFESGVIKFDGKKFTNYSTRDGLVYHSVISIHEDRKGNMWFGTLGGGVSRFDGNSFMNITTKQGLSSNQVTAICEDSYGNLWFSTVGGGVCKYKDGAFKAYSDLQGLPDKVIYCLNEDQQGNLWLGTQEGGLIKFDGKNFTNYSTNQGMFYWLWGITTAKSGDLWLATYGEGACKYDGKSFTYFSRDQGLISDNIYSVFEDKNGSFWFAMEDGLARLSGDTIYNYTNENGLPVSEINSIIQDKKNRIWLATAGGGISCFDGNTFATYSTEQGLSHENVYCIVEDDTGILWIGTSNGLNRFDGNNFITYSTDQGLSANQVYGMTLDKEGNLVLGTEDGLTVITGFKEKSKPISNETPITPVSSSLSNTEFFIYQPVIKKFNRSTGYPVKNATDGGNNGPVICDSKGTVWIGTREKLLAFNYADVGKKSQPPDLEIINIKINNEPVVWNDILAQRKNSDSTYLKSSMVEEAGIFGKLMSPEDRKLMTQKFQSLKFDSLSQEYPIPQGLIIPNKLNTITVEFAAIELAQPFLAKYQYMLEGYDKEWSPELDHTTATFGNIREGKYTFKARAKSPDGIWSEPIVYSFNVLPPWYRTRWMYLIYLAGAIGVLVLIFRWRTAALRKEKELLEQKVVERTAEVVAQKNEAEKQRRRSDELLLNILPEEVAEELKITGSSSSKGFEEVTVLFTDFKNFSKHSEKMNAKQLVDEINYCYSAFDRIISKFGIEKIKTIGDSYMCAGGLPVEKKSNPVDTVMAALAIRDFMIEEREKRKAMGKTFFEIRIGLHTGPVVAGIVGIKKFAYDIWGDTVNIASRMESSGEEGKVNISGTTYEIVKEKFNCTHRGMIEAKNKGMIDMYFVDGLK